MAQRPHTSAIDLDAETTRFWLKVSAAAFAVVVLLVGFLVIGTHSNFISVPNQMLSRWVIYFWLGGAAAAFVVGALKANATVSGKRLGWQLQVGGAAAVLTITVAGSWYAVESHSKSGSLIDPVSAAVAKTLGVQLEEVPGTAFIIQPYSLQQFEKGFLFWRQDEAFAYSCTERTGQPGKYGTPYGELRDFDQKEKAYLGKRAEGTNFQDRGGFGRAWFDYKLEPMLGWPVVAEQHAMAVIQEYKQGFVVFPIPSFSLGVNGYDLIHNPRALFLGITLQKCASVPL